MQPSLRHGGDWDALAARWPAAAQPWIDLSTGINPWPYPVGDMGPETWARLPQRAMERACRAAMADYLGCDPAHVHLTAGSQLPIALLPRLLKARSVAILAPTYGEHDKAWRAAGLKPRSFAAGDPLAADADIIVVTQPNNPDGHVFGRADLLALVARQAAKGGYLVIDEAFADLDPAISLADQAGREGLVILRSFGKFFGLAGLRLGAALCGPELREQLDQAVGPWSVSGPALAIGTRAYQDANWIADMRWRLRAARENLDALLTAAGLGVMGGTDLYRLVRAESAWTLADHLAARGIYARRFDHAPACLRFGLPPDEAARRRLQTALKDFRP